MSCNLSELLSMLLMFSQLSFNSVSYARLSRFGPDPATTIDGSSLVIPLYFTLTFVVPRMFTDCPVYVLRLTLLVIRGSFFLASNLACSACDKTVTLHPVSISNFTRHSFTDNICMIGDTWGMLASVLYMVYTSSPGTSFSWSWR